MRQEHRTLTLALANDQVRLVELQEESNGEEVEVQRQRKELLRTIADNEREVQAA